ncbi:MAG: hypothetical protein QXK76_00125 [Candidatus Woesearchaeota archaeon]
MYTAKKGRPIGSEVRQRIVDILYVYKELYGYEIAKIYSELFGKITTRLIYYHLKKGTSLGEFSVKKIEQKQGEYSWGKTSEIIVYSLGNNANPRMNDIVINHFKKKNTQ